MLELIGRFGSAYGVVGGKCGGVGPDVDTFERVDGEIEALVVEREAEYLGMACWGAGYFEVAFLVGCHGVEGIPSAAAVGGLDDERGALRAFHGALGMPFFLGTSGERSHCGDSGYERCKITIHCIGRNCSKLFYILLI